MFFDCGWDYTYIIIVLSVCHSVLINIIPQNSSDNSLNSIDSLQYNILGKASSLLTCHSAFTIYCNICLYQRNLIILNYTIYGFLYYFYITLICIIIKMILFAYKSKIKQLSKTVKQRANKKINNTNSSCLCSQLKKKIIWLKLTITKNKIIHMTDNIK